MSQDHPAYANLANLKALEELYIRYLEQPTSVDSSWQNFFDGMELGSTLPKALPSEETDLRVALLINAYRTYGHLMAHCDVTRRQTPEMPAQLRLERFSLLDRDLNTPFSTEGLSDKKQAPLSEIIELLSKTYCRSIGIEYMHLDSVEIKTWIQQRIEPGFPENLTKEDQIDILNQLNQAEEFESFIHTKYAGQKRFSLEGAEAFIPTLHAILQRGGDLGVGDVMLGMAHRGRLNVLASIMGKPQKEIFEEFEESYLPKLHDCRGDVKYHTGYAGTYTTKGGRKIRVVLSANPSHLESVNPVVEGSARAIQEQKKGCQRDVVPILVHGDAAVAGQGVVYETMGFKELKGYGTGGTIHIVINNQIGFTTLPEDSRSTHYCTDIAKAFGAPVLHVNGEDPQACVAAAHLAIELRHHFATDVFIDLMGYRKYGHNESDEPSFTQPLRYELIRSKQSVRKIYRDRLISSSVISKEEADLLEKRSRDVLTGALDEVKSNRSVRPSVEQCRQGKHLEKLLETVDTHLPEHVLKELGVALGMPPKGITLHPKVLRLLKERRAMTSAAADKPVFDWGMGEMLAYASLATEGTHIRLSGQDVCRGTFSHRHALYVDQLSAEHYYPLSHLAQSQASVDVFNSSLSEYAVMGFEFGYSSMHPQSLVLWEGQFGDFSNGAQIIIDQYLASSEIKWGQATNMVLLLPHGYEGMGPEHSSARIERFLQLCADENLFVVNCSTPAQLFHALRRQVKRTLRKPLVIFTPKVLLRHPLCRSPMSAFTAGHFEEILPDEQAPRAPERLLFCTGKIYYDLIQERQKRGAADVIIRIEQLYPLHEQKLQSQIARYPTATVALWVQEEHQNMGAYTYIRPKLERLLGEKLPLHYVGRSEAASPAAGASALHKWEHASLLNQLYEGTDT